MTEQQLKDKAHLDSFLADVEQAAKKHGVESYGVFASRGENGKSSTHGDYRMIRHLWKEHEAHQVKSILAGDYTCGCEKPNPRFLSWNKRSKRKN